MSLSIKTEHINYVAKVVKLDLLKPHPNADKIQLAVIDFQNVITSLDAQLGDLYVFFPVESQINAEFISFVNGYASKELNQDPEIKGYFDKNARVKCQKFRGLPSEGYIHPIKSINAWLESKGCSYLLSEKDVGTEFDTVGDITLCKKYVIKTGRKSKEQRQLSGECRVADGQFNLHTETGQFKRNLSKINPEDYISISYKMHGSNAVFSNILVKRRLSFIEKVAKFFGAKIEETKYDYVWSSRKVIKNRVEGQILDPEDVWNCAAKSLEGCIEPGISLYTEIVGQKPTGAWIQGQYDYGTGPKQHAVYVFRITHTDSTGKVREFSTLQIQEYCEKYNLNVCPVFFYGKVHNYLNLFSTKTVMEGELIKFEEEDIRYWREKLLEKLVSQFNEKDCYMCKNQVPEEGVVIRKEGSKFEAFKLKSLRFLKKETDDLDKQEKVDTFENNEDEE